ncbi:tRNA1(Val) (adenine(37)-N6)-methyltransferase [Shewanella salipaludis]|uniref:tRNA1(Val) (adenine(37)-N6)-methyltransferase n=1 Tax=Shewanella salipaludis TaxID=2723052 RepID=A0A972FWD6_9GAMM|nr:methyltransferase [Shewanella salipaludis]NMH66484.1 methyltransferase [Shewanella salipaludis]
MGFSFKQFHIDDAGCGMPVSTDGVLLGAWAPLTRARHILDIGAGSGLLSLMAAQRTHEQARPQAQIVAVELDEAAALACRHNFANSPWPDRLSLHHTSIQDYSERHPGSPRGQEPALFEHIICNPPYFESGLLSGNPARANARHTERLSFAALLSAITRLLHPSGSVSLILPLAGLPRLMPLLAQTGLVLRELQPVASVETKAPQRGLLLLQKAQTPQASMNACMTHPVLTVRDRHGHYSPAMAALTRDFYLKL